MLDLGQFLAWLVVECLTVKHLCPACVPFAWGVGLSDPCVRLKAGSVLEQVGHVLPELLGTIGRAVLVLLANAVQQPRQANA
jgi:hypothetical protein